MVRYFFDIRRADGQLDQDDSGTEFTTFQEAQAEATKTLGKITADEGAPGMQIEIRTGSTVLCAIAVTLHLRAA